MAGKQQVPMQYQDMLGYFACPAAFFPKLLELNRFFSRLAMPAFCVDNNKDLNPISIRVKRDFPPSEISSLGYEPAGSQFRYWENQAPPNWPTRALWRGASTDRADSTAAFRTAGFASIYGK